MSEVLEAPTPEEMGAYLYVGANVCRRRGTFHIGKLLEISRDAGGRPTYRVAWHPDRREEITTDELVDVHGPKCDACGYRFRPGEPQYEGLKTGALLCGSDARETGTEWVKRV